MDLGSAAAAPGAGKRRGQETTAYEAKMNYTVAGKPLDFSFMRI